jgi:hypothetical protein
VNFFSRPAPVEPPLTTDADRLAEAHAAYKAAEREFAHACANMAAYNARTRDDGFKVINGQTYFQINSDPQRLALSSIVEHTRHRRNELLNAWSDLKFKTFTNERVCVSGVLQVVR